MMTNCTTSPTDKKAYAREVGQILIRDVGKQKYYSPEQVKKASQKSKYNIDWHCWAMCLYVSPSDFDQYHKSLNETCDYSAMKSEMLEDITDGASSSWTDIDLSWLEWPDFDFSFFDLFN